MPDPEWAVPGRRRRLSPTRQPRRIGSGPGQVRLQLLVVSYRRDAAQSASHVI